MNQPVRPLVQTADFERVLKAPTAARSVHFAVHHLHARPVVRSRSSVAVEPSAELPTDDAPTRCEVVDNPPPPPEGLWLGTVVPKRHAKRSVTRHLVKRQMREAVRRHGDRLPPGLWVLRLKSGFDAAQFSSAASDALRASVRAELDTLLRRAASR